MKVRDIILGMTGIDIPTKMRADSMVIKITPELEEALERNVVVEMVGDDITLSIEDIKYEGEHNRVVIEVE